MIVIDSSAIVAIVMDEIEAAAFERLLVLRTGDLRMSAASLVETTMVIEGRAGEPAGRDLDLLLHRSRVQIAPVDERRADLARSAWRRYGKGRHPAGLNFGDCFAYAEAAVDGSPLLYKGDDFAKTDITSASA